MPVAKDKKGDKSLNGVVSGERTKAGQQPSPELRKRMLAADDAVRVEFHRKWGCSKCAWKSCTPSCWRAKGIDITSYP